MTDLINDPQELSKLSEAFQKVSEDTEITTEAPLSNTVELPGGYVFSNGIVETTATVRELNGFDEEAIAKAGSPAGALNIVLERGLVSIGDKTLSKTDLDSLLIGDRDAILLAIRKVTFGKTVEFDTVCNYCIRTQIVTVDLDTDIETKVLEDRIKDRVLIVDTKAGEVKIVLPNLLTNKRISDDPNATYSEVLTELLSGCIVSVNDAPSLGRSTALNLVLVDREAIADALYENASGPRLAEVSKACEACGKGISLPLSLASLFRL